MHYWRVTKYDPKNRDERGYYKKDEWTSIGDIGSEFDGVEFTFEEYLFYENAYVAAVLRVMNKNNIKTLKVKALEKHHFLHQNGFFEPETRIFYKSLKTNTIISTHDVALVVRFALRKQIWCKLVNDKMFVHVGDDYYMFIGSENRSESMLKAITASGLFVENFISPYLSDAEFKRVVRSVKL